MTERNQPLTASLYLPKDGDSDSVKNAIMIAPATGIKRAFYHNFASYLASQGFGVIAMTTRHRRLINLPAVKCDASLIAGTP